MPQSKSKTVTMQVTVKCPSWLTPTQARLEVRELINNQTHYGHQRRDPQHDWDEIGEHNFRGYGSISAIKPSPA